MATRSQVMMAVALLALSACGRFGFDPGGGNSGDAAATDGAAGIDGATCLSGELLGPTGTCVPALALDSSVVGYWPLDEAAGALLFRDRSPNGHDGTCVDPCPVAGGAGIRAQ